ncbi:carbamoyl-phosphate synthase large subunit [Intestinibacillus sp. NTUH-41-i26]|uniref:carbamoyl-phosphate synthase large subunit n=1 Tax=Butyricicoccaceae TaxID=3085642 RepID=UPI000D1FB2E2|nr:MULTISPECIES: carbamoyl-phosphate synthase large subunit [Butyricicoccaceae]WOC75329.1 carbamoyl-phosphate synthase large subunit [Intestinibacillus sp. NTUH-41-i26]
MPLRKDIHKVMVLGSGPIVIGQAAEFDYAGTQACRALREEGLEVVLVNSNPATIMTDKAMADKVYIEPMTVEAVQQIIKKERPDSLLPNLGGQTGLNLAMELCESGFLDQMGVKLLGAKPDTIAKAEDRQMFKDTMEKIGEPCIASKVVHTVEDAVEFTREIGLPVIIRPAYTLGGTGGGIAYTWDELREIAATGIMYSRVDEILVEKCITGWKEIEYEVMRDAKGNAITICNMENVDPVGVHTGDSVVVAPSQTLCDKEYQMLRTSALNIITELGIEGGCNVQFALHPTSFEYAVIEVNPRVSRSSALASKATGYPIAKVTAKIAVGYGLDEIENAVTKKTKACFEPTIDYCVVKFPRWPFDKFVYADNTLGTQMKATGEVMAIDNSFEGALMKAVRGCEIKLDSMIVPRIRQQTDAEVKKGVARTDDQRLFHICEALRRGIMTIEEIHEVTTMDTFFLHKFQNIIDTEKALATADAVDAALYLRAKKMGFLDKTIEQLSGKDISAVKRLPVYKMVDTCAAEFEAETPYYYSTYDEESEVKPASGKKKVLVLGSGPIRIGQGIEFDYCSVHAVWALQKLGCETVIINNNPETVSTDFDTADRLYFEPLTPEDVTGVAAAEKPDFAIVQFGGQTAINLAAHIEKLGIPILGTPAWSIDAAEDREKFDVILEKCGIPRPAGHTVMTEEEAVKAADELGYPVLVRPSYVLGGQGMEIAYKEEDVREFMQVISRNKVENPVLVDKYMMGREIEVDAICDGDDILIPGIMEHFERAGVHSGDSISIYPSINIEQKHKDTIIRYTEALAKNLAVLGLVNIQFVLYNDQVYVIEVNPRSSRTVPYISKVTGVPMVDLATRCMFGEKLRDMGCGTGLHPESDHYAVKVPVFSFQKLRDLDTQLGPEMKSTGEVLGVSTSFREALLKGLTGAGFQMKKKGAVLISVRDSDKQEAIRIGERFESLGFDIYATSGTANVLNRHMVATNAIRNVDEPSPNIIDLIESGKIDYVIATSVKGRHPELGSVHIRRTAVERAIPCLTSIDTASALLRCLEGDVKIENCEMVDINKI